MHQVYLLLFSFLHFALLLFYQLKIPLENVLTNTQLQYVCLHSSTCRFTLLHHILCFKQVISWTVLPPVSIRFYLSRQGSSCLTDGFVFFEVVILKHILWLPSKVCRQPDVSATYFIIGSNHHQSLDWLVYCRWLLSAPLPCLSSWLCQVLVN